MEDQLQLMNQMDIIFRIGDEIQGEILKIGNDEIFVSLVGYKTDGIIPFKELTYAENLEATLNNLKVGDRIKAKVIKLRNEDNYVVLSRLEYEKEETLEVLEGYFNKNEAFNVMVKKQENMKGWGRGGGGGGTLRFPSPMGTFWWSPRELGTPRPAHGPPLPPGSQG